MRCARGCGTISVIVPKPVIAPCVYVSTTFVVLRWQHVMRQEGSHPDLRYESKMLKVAPQDNTTIDFVFFGVVAVDLVFVERILWSVITTETNFFLRNLNICLLLYTRLLQGQSEGHQLLTMMINVVVGLMFSKVAKFRSLQMKGFFYLWGHWH